MNAAKKRPEDGSGKSGNPVQSLEDDVIDALRTVYDPEIPVNIYELGLVYSMDIKPAGTVIIRMTLPHSGCPVAASLPVEVESRLREVPGVVSARVEIVWDPPWNPEMISETGRLQLGIF
jgi:FeS assembly SUF system protein